MSRTSSLSDALKGLYDALDKIYAAEKAHYDDKQDSIDNFVGLICVKYPEPEANGEYECVDGTHVMRCDPYEDALAPWTYVDQEYDDDASDDGERYRVWHTYFEIVRAHGPVSRVGTHTGGME